MADAESELHLLSRYLDAYRGAIRWKVAGLTREQAARSMVPSGTSLLGIVKHMGYVEQGWFQEVIDRRELESIPPDEEFTPADNETVDQMVAFFDEQCAISREILSSRDLDEMVPFHDGELSIRDVVVHMIEETARHAGHMDILREQIDGQTGGFPPGGLPWS
ncbi:MAG: DinB family protein [Acidimicrobiia bacterium]|nr:DinB family protein [Acidimicrobiia bacterium]